MPRLRPNQVPAYRLHKSSGQGVVTLDGPEFYLGCYEPEHKPGAGRVRYERLVADWLSNGRTPAVEFGPRALKDVKQAMIDHRLERKSINRHVGWLRRMFKWPAEEALIQAVTFQIQDPHDPSIRGKPVLGG